MDKEEFERNYLHFVFVSLILFFGGLFIYNSYLENYKSDYRIAHNLQPVKVDGLIFDYTEPAKVELGIFTAQNMELLIRTSLTLLFYIFLGIIVSKICQFLTKIIDDITIETFDKEKSTKPYNGIWSRTMKIYLLAIWPILIIVGPILLLHLVSLSIYSAVYKE